MLFENARRCIRNSLRAGLTVPLLTGMAASVPAQHVAEQEPRPGEQRFNRFIYKASHNSYAQSESLNDQIDNYNVWQVELDIWWNNGGCNTVRHCCTDNTHSFSAELSNIFGAVTGSQRFTVVYLEMKVPGGWCPCQENWPSRPVYRQCIYDTIAGAGDVGRVYTAGDFVSVDQSRWPSWQELVRRGKHLMFILDDLAGDLGGPFDDSFFFGVTTSDPPPTGLPANTVLVSLNAGCDTYPIEQGPQQVNDRWLYRAWPGNCALDACIHMNDEYWTTAVGLGFNLVATNCVDQDHTLAAPTHSPQPLYVREYYPSADPQYGTLGFPYISDSGLISGIDRASPMVDVIISGATYNVTGVGGSPYVIAKPVVLKARPSAVGADAIWR